MRILEKWQKADPLYRIETHYITEKEIEALIEGKRLYFDVNWEYAVVIKFKSQKKKIEREKKKLIKILDELGWNDEKI
jgi:hypothetical protein